MIRSALASVCSLLLLASCATYEQSPLDPVLAGERFEHRRLDDPKLLAALAELDNRNPATSAAASQPDSQPQATTTVGPIWDVERLSRAALLYNHDLALAYAHLSTLTAGEITARESPNPTVAFSPSYATKAEGMNPWTIGWTFDIPIESANKRGIRMAHAAALSDAARAQVAETAWKIRSTVRDALANYLLTTREAELFEIEVQHRQHYADLLDARLRAGEASRPDVATALLDLLNTRQAWRIAQGQVGESRARLAAAIGLPVSGLGDAELRWSNLEELPPISGDDQSRLRTMALENRLDLHRALLDYAAGEHALELEVARQYPDLHIGPGYQFDQGQNKWELGASIELPILNQNAGAIAEARARRREDAVKVDAIQAAAIADLEAALARYAAAQLQLADVDQQLATDAAQVDSARAALAAGEQDRPTLLSLEVLQDAARRQRLDALRKAREARNALEDAIQQPLDASMTVMRTPPL